MKTTTKTNKEEKIMKTNQNTFFGIIAALIAVIFTLAAFTACPQPTETPAPVDETDMGTYGELKIVNETGKPKVGYSAFAKTVKDTYINFKNNNQVSGPRLRQHITNGGTVKIVLAAADSQNLSPDGKELIIILNVDFVMTLAPETQISVIKTVIGAGADMLPPVAMLNNSFTKAHIASLFKAGHARA